MCGADTGHLQGDTVHGQKRYVDGVCEEIADVIIMCEQVKRIFNISTADVEKEKERKLARLERYINTDEP